LASPGVIQEAEPMPTIKLTKKEIEKLPAPHPSGKQQLIGIPSLRASGCCCRETTTAKS